MKEGKFTSVEEVARRKLKKNYDEVLRTTPAKWDIFQKKYPQLMEQVSKEAESQRVENLGNVFRPGIPDFLGINENGEYKFVEVKGEGDGLRHSQLKWIRDYRDLNVEIWFADSNEGITERMDSDRIDAYSLRRPEDRGEIQVKEGSKGYLNIPIPKTLAASYRIKEGNKIRWRVKDESEIRLVP